MGFAFRGCSSFRHRLTRQSVNPYLRTRDDSSWSFLSFLLFGNLHPMFKRLAGHSYMSRVNLIYIRIYSRMHVREFKKSYSLTAWVVILPAMSVTVKRTLP